ncbi:hypothetical protein [Dactylosporangium sp. NPDC005555]|uniref:hypothetical protein n=1 Tax=Dactylosporangium sp. NPDC005555 TaxID=3154889 RepID=UPI0033B6302F
MDSRAMAISVGTGIATTWLTAKVMKELKLPAIASPIVGAAVAMAVNKLVSRLR